MCNSIILWCKRYIYALLDKDEKIIQTNHEIQQLQQLGIDPSKWKTLVGNKLRISFNLVFLGLSILSNVILLIQGQKNFIELSAKLNDLFDTNEYSILQINDYIQVCCMILGFCCSLYAVYHWKSMIITNKYILYSWGFLLMSSLILILIPPYYFMRVYSRLHQDFYDIYHTITTDDTYSSSSISNSTIFDTIQLLIQIIEVYVEILVNSFTIVVLLPFMFRNNVIHMRKQNIVYSTVSRVLHTTMSIIEIFLSVIVINICILFQFEYYSLLIVSIVLYNLWKQSQYIFNYKYPILQNVIFIGLCIVGGVYVIILEINIYSFISNFFVSYFINNLAIRIILQPKQQIMYSYSSSNITNSLFENHEYELFPV